MKNHQSRSKQVAIFRILSTLFIVTIIIAFIKDCLAREKAEYSSAESTISKYTSSHVCANSTKYHRLKTIKSSKEAKRRNMNIVHCGECGHCSTNNDIDIMYETKDSLTKTATHCAVRGLLFGDRATENCLEDNVGFTPSCSSCWSDNIHCTRVKCRFTCLKSVLLREPNNYDGKLNSCLECDEKLCGPAFLKCAGANRRRLGIVSDIERDSIKEQCHIDD